MRLELRMKYLETIYQRYHRASKRSKGRILDELCKVCKYSRKYAIWKLNRLREEEPKVHKARHRGKKYDHKILSIVEVIYKNLVFELAVVCSHFCPISTCRHSQSHVL